MHHGEGCFDDVKSACGCTCFLPVIYVLCTEVGAVSAFCALLPSPVSYMFSYVNTDTMHK